MSTPQTRWEQNWIHDSSRWQSYADKFAHYYADGTDMDGEARFVDMLAPRHATVLDAGCGTGRVAAGIAARGHRVVGVDKDAGLVQIGGQRYPGLPLLVHDLVALDSAILVAAGQPDSFDVIVCPGNVMVYLAAGTERQVLANLSALLKPGGRVVFGFATDREYTVDGLDSDAQAVGLAFEHRFGTWQLDLFDADADWAVSVFRAAGRAVPADGPDGRWIGKGNSDEASRSTAEGR
ncbi:MAG: class I SAM-dependent methyltransferase [Actinomycetota bacterium]|nr:class I SAM-dependent methyltransferase [Actinomycetota bacterium]